MCVIVWLIIMITKGGWWSLDKNSSLSKDHLLDIKESIKVIKKASEYLYERKKFIQETYFVVKWLFNYSYNCYNMLAKWNNHQNSV